MAWCFEFKKTRYEDLRLDADVYPESGIVINHTLAYHGFMEFGSKIDSIHIWSLADPALFLQLSFASLNAFGRTRP